MIELTIRKSHRIDREGFWVIDVYPYNNAYDLPLSYITKDGTRGDYEDYATREEAQKAVDLYWKLNPQEKISTENTSQNKTRSFDSGATRDIVRGKLIPVSHKDYMSLADAYDKHSRILMSAKGEEYAIAGDFLAMENRLAGILGDTPEYISLVMAGKHIAAIGIILEKNDVTKIKLEKLDERIRDATNLLKITSAFVHAKQNDFSLHLGKEE